jgi:hypothetical protein
VLQQIASHSGNPTCICARDFSVLAEQCMTHHILPGGGKGTGDGGGDGGGDGDDQGGLGAMFLEYLEVAQDMAAPGAVISVRDLQHLRDQCCVIQAYARGKCARNRARREQLAAVRLQAVYRGHRARLLLLDSQSAFADAIDS